MLFITQMSIAKKDELKSIENEDLCGCQAMPQYNEYENHNYVLMSYGVYACVADTTFDRIPLSQNTYNISVESSILLWISEKFHGTK